jgi:hypothetical protein
MFALPRGSREFGPQQLRDVDLDDYLALEVLARVEVEICVARSGEAVGLEQA